MMSLSLFLTLRLALGSLLVATPALAIPYGLQTADSRSSYGGSFHYDVNNHVVYMTGQTYGSFWNDDFGDPTTSTTSDCYFGILQLPSSDTTDSMLPPSWLFKSKLGIPDVVETCGPLTVQGSKAYLGGWSEPNGLLSELRASGSTRSEQYGLILDVDISLQKVGAVLPTTTDMRGGRLVHNTNGPQSTVSLVLSDLADALYMASLESDDTATVFETSSDQPNYSTGGVLKRGSDFYITIEKLTPTPGVGITETLARSQEREIATLQGIDNVAGMLLFNDTTLVLAGSAVGSNDAIPNIGIIGSDTDGFVSFLSADDLRIIGGMRLQSQADRDDYINDVCMNPGDKYIYVVGSTKGSFTTALNVQEVTEAFIIKIDPANQKIVWIKSLTAQLGTQPANIEGLACAVTRDGLHVYLGGVVKDSATIDTQVTEGGDDFAFAQYNAETGDLVWTQQYGTRGHENLCDLETDKEGHLIVFGTTDGSYFRERLEGGFTDVVILGLARSNGAGPVNIDLGNPRPPSDLILNPAQPRPAPTPAPTFDTLGLVATPEPAAKKGKKGGVIMACLFAVSAVIAVFLVWRRRRNRESYPDSAQVLEYLRGFEDVEVDLRHSATGGYHGTYVNHDGGPRYYKGDSETVSFGNGNEMSPLTYDPIVEQSLFSIDDDDSPLYGGSGSGSLKRQASNYDGLMDAYNTAWGDLSQHQLPSQSPRMTSSRGSLSARAILEDVDDHPFQEVDIRGDKSKSPSAKIAKSKAKSMRWRNEII